MTMLDILVLPGSFHSSQFQWLRPDFFVEMELMPLIFGMNPDITHKKTAVTSGIE